MRKFLCTLVAALIASCNGFAADMPVKAPAVPFVLGYSGNGWYKFVGTSMQVANSTVANGSTSTWGASLIAGFGYQWTTSPGSFMALEGSCGWQNLGGSTVVGSLTSTWECEQDIKFGGATIAALFNWIPAGLSFPTLPNLGAATGVVHPYIGLANVQADAHATIVGVSKHNISDKVSLKAGMLQQYCRDNTGTQCATTDLGIRFTPRQQGFDVLGTKQNIGSLGQVFWHVAF